jgi:phosphatidylserine decarboxylase
MTRVYDRKTQQISEVPQYGEDKLKRLYGSKSGRLKLRIATGHLYSNYNAWKNSRAKSKAKIAPFVKEHNIQAENLDQYKSFADFFSRREKRSFVKDKDALISPADSKLLCYKIDDSELISIKNTVYSIEDLTGEDISDYAGGTCLVFRLAMDDYHRYCFVDSGKVTKTAHIKGRLHTVSSISDQYKVFAQNDRIVNILETENFGPMIQVEIGALLVGRIKNHGQTEFKKGEEKGYFEMGGSTIVLLVKKGIKIDEDILKQSKNSIETIVKYGERIGGK